jgi:nucleoside-diphosphate-sugar epimerase
LKGAETVYHLAAMPGLMKSWTDLKLYQDCNILATGNLLKGLDSSTLKMFINISTSSVYGLNAIGDEESPLNPISPYGVTKLAAENLVRAYCGAMSLPFNIVRPFSVYGPRQRPDMAFNILINKINENQQIDIFGDGHASRSNTYVLDLVNGLVLLGGSNNICETYNLCGTENFSIIEVVRLVEEVLGKKAQISYKPARLGDQLRTFGSSKKAEEHFGFIARMNFKEGIRRQAEWQLR